MKRPYIWILSCALSAASPLRAQTDSLNVQPDKATFIDRLAPSRALHMTCISVPLMAGGLIIKNEDDHFRKLRNNYLPHFNCRADDYLQYLPAAVMVGMKVSGVEGRSSWGRMLASDAFSTLLTGGIVYSLKRTTHVTRPDGSNDRSFPSGHTATAFMTATMLTKEYGHKSPWIGVDAYSVATATGLMRVANNKHWLSDVLTGAGIGILSTEIGYYLADLIFREKGVKRFASVTPGRLDKPSFFGLYVGMNIPLNDYGNDTGGKLNAAPGSTAGVEGAWFLSPYVGLGGRFTVSNTSVTVNDKTAEAHSLDAVSLCVGGYFSYPLSSRFLAGGKLLGGYVRYPQWRRSDAIASRRDGFCFGSGISLTFRATEYYGMKLFMDYNLTSPYGKGNNELMSALAIGSSFVIAF